MINSKKSLDGYYRLPESIDEHISEYSKKTEYFLKGKLSAEEFKKIRVINGIYEQREDNTYMVRIRISAGMLTLSQAECISDLAQIFGNGEIHVTTRQDIQLHDIKIENTPEIMRHLQKVNLTLIGGGGNSIRNIIAPPMTGISTSEVFNVAPFAHVLTEYILQYHNSFNLPRKFKIAFSGSMSDATYVQVNDLGFQAEMRNEIPGFKVYAGGGMGAKSRIADVIYDWTPATECIRVAETARRLFEYHGDRTNRNRARFRFVFEKFGTDKMITLFNEEMKNVIKQDIPQCRISTEIVSSTAKHSLNEFSEKVYDGLCYVPQKQNDYIAVPVKLPCGLIQADDFKKLINITRIFSLNEGLRTTQNQGLLITHIKKEKLKELSNALSNLIINVKSSSFLPSIVTCPGPITCRLGICNSRGVAKACAKAIDNTDLIIDHNDEITIKISGCPNACGQHLISSIGFSGVIRKHNGNPVPSYKVVINSGKNTKNLLSGETIGTIPERLLPEFLISLLTDFKENKLENESFTAYTVRREIDYFKELVDSSEEKWRGK